MIIVKPRSQVLLIWRILLTIIAFVPALLIGLFLSHWAFWVAFFVWLILYLTLYLWFLPAFFRSLLYIIDEQKVTMKCGVFYKTLYTVPLGNVQFTELTVSPFARLFGVVTLKIVAPGASIILPGLSLKEARMFAKKIALKQEETV